MSDGTTTRRPGRCAADCSAFVEAGGAPAGDGPSATEGATGRRTWVERRVTGS